MKFVSWDFLPRRQNIHRVWIQLLLVDGIEAPRNLHCRGVNWLVSFLNYQSIFYGLTHNMYCSFSSFNFEEPSFFGEWDDNFHCVQLSKLLLLSFFNNWSNRRYDSILNWFRELLLLFFFFSNWSNQRYDSSINCK